MAVEVLPFQKLSGLLNDKTQESEYLVYSTLLDLIASSKLRISDHNAQSMVKIMFISYQTFMRRSVLGQIIFINQNVVVQNVLFTFCLDSLQYELQLNLELLRKDLKTSPVSSIVSLMVSETLCWIVLRVSAPRHWTCKHYEFF